MPARRQKNFPAGAAPLLHLQKGSAQVVVLHQPDNFFAVSQAYASFANLTDGEVLTFLEKWEKNHISSADKS